MFMMIRAYAGGECSRDFQDLVSESITVEMMLRHYDMTMPGESTINDNAGAVTNRTRRMIHRLQVRHARAEGLDDFAEMTVDSTAVEADTAWPTDSMIILKLLARIWRIGSDLEQYGTENLQRHWTEQWLKKMRRENLAIVMADGKGERYKHYHEFFEPAENAVEHLEAEPQAMEERMRARDERSAVESLIFTLQSNHGFGRVSRRGIEAVRAELLEDALAHNFCRMAQLQAQGETETIPKAA
jgi:hypothetical protein